MKNLFLWAALLLASLTTAIPAFAAEPEMVRIPGQNYEIGKYEVTLREWRELMGDTGVIKKVDCEDDNCPASYTAWDDVQIFIDKLNQKTGKSYRLPTREEWLTACFAGRQTKYCGGDDADSVARYRKGKGGSSIWPVGQTQANAYGIYDMTGNVAEWLQDEGVKEKGTRMYIPGSYMTQIDDLELLTKNALEKWERHERNIGFRLARSLTASAEPKKEVPPKPEKKVNKEMAAACKCVFDNCDKLLLTKGGCRDEHDAEYCQARDAANAERKASVRNAAKPARAEKLKTCNAWKAAGPDAASDGFKAQLKQQDEAIAAAEKLANAEYDRKLSAIEAAEKQRIAAKGNAAKAEQQAGKAAQAKREAENAKAAADRKAKDEQHRQWCLADSKRLNLCECVAYAPAGAKTCSK